MASINWKTIGMILSVISTGVALVSSIVDDKKMEGTIEDKVNEALTNRENLGS